MRALEILAVTALGVGLLAGTACDKPRFSEPMTLAGQPVSADVLNKGHENYTLYCRSCHGDNGDGNGVAAWGLRPPPRDFRQGQYKFGWVVDGMPHDADFARIVKDGLHGTAMLPWDMTDAELQSVIPYIKTFAAEDWKDAQLGTQVVPTPDPWGEAKSLEAVAKGKDIYHGVAQCWSCHPAYETKTYIAGIRTTSSFREGMYLPEVKESQYLKDGRQVTILPPDFTWSSLRSIRSGSELGDLYSLIGAGIPGTAMPTWKGALPEEDLWALAYYVRSLIQLRDTEQAAQMRRDLEGQPEFVPPAPVDPALASPEGATGAAPSGAGL